MIESNNYTKKFIQAIYLASLDTQLVNPRQRKSTENIGVASRLEQELLNSQSELKAIEETHGVNMLDLTLMRKFIMRLFRNERINRYVESNAPDIYQGLKSNILERRTMFENIEDIDDSLLKL